jgi:two-component system LytT family sensor kinase
MGMHGYVLHELGFDWKTAITDSFVNNFILADCCAVIVITLKWYQPRKNNGLLLLVWIIGLAKVCSLLTGYVLSYLLKEDTAYLVFLDKSVLVRIGIAFLLISGVTLETWVFNIYRDKQADTEKQKETEKLLKEAELTGLRQQLQPHFLFNSLNSISALAGSKPEEARKMIQQLSDFLRGTLKKDEQKPVTLKEELNHLQLYLDIEKVRFGHRLSTEVKADEDSLDLLLPPLLLQPLVENAIKFGLYDTVGEITISIVAKKETGYLTVHITNPFDSQTAQPKGTGFGLNSVQRRLQLIFSRSDLLQTGIKENIFTATVKIPQFT